MIHKIKRRLLIRALLALSIFLLASVSFATEPYQAKVIGISDGDTIKVLHEGTQVKIRLYGIDTPEKRQVFGSKAKQFTSGQVFGKAVTVVPMDTDRYGRTVALIESLDTTGTLMRPWCNRVTPGSTANIARLVSAQIGWRWNKWQGAED